MTPINGSNVTTGHLGIVAGVFDTLEIGQYIDEVIPKTRHYHITHGTGVKALSLNGLGYNEGRLSLMPDFFEFAVPTAVIVDYSSLRPLRSPGAPMIPKPS
ncbi:MAG: DUF4277 domain-containing protein [Methanoregula sp.]|nr:DUF4277 domain-containing protein [Methanoregula sp.]